MTLGVAPNPTKSSWPYAKCPSVLPPKLSMGLDQLQMAPLVREDSLLRLLTTQGKVFVMQHETFFIQDK